MIDKNLALILDGGDSAGELPVKRNANHSSNEIHLQLAGFSPIDDRLSPIGQRDFK